VLSRDDLLILITATLNTGKSIGEINAAIKGIEKKINKLKLRVEVPQDFQKHVESFINAAEKLKKVSDEQKRVVSETIKEFEYADGTTKKIIQRQLADGQIITSTTEKIKEQTKTVQQLSDDVERLGLEYQKTYRVNKDGTQILTQEIRQTEDLNRQIIKYNEQGKVTSNIIKDNIGQREKYNKNLEHTIKLYQQQARINVDDLTRRFGEDIDHNALSKWLDDVNSLNRSVPDVDKRMKELSTSLKEIETNAKRIQEIRKRGTLIGQSNDLIGNEVTENQLKNVLALNEAFKDREIREISLNSTTGKWTATLKENENQNRILKGTIDKTTGSIYLQENALKQAHASQLGVLKQLEIAAKRVPVWMLAMTSFYAPIRGLREAVRNIIEIDTQMTELARVLPDQVELSDILQTNIKLANQLGKSIQDINEAAIGFARQGFGEDQIKYLTEAAVLAANVSELTVEESMSAMTAAMTIFNVKAEDSVRIIDALNEVDNNFAITTKDLALALQRAGSTAVAFNVTLEEMIGHATAIGVQTRESGSVIGNALKTIYSRLTTMDSSIDALDSIGIKIKDASGEMKSATQIISELQEKWNSLSAEQQQNIAVTLAGKNLPTIQVIE